MPLSPEAAELYRRLAPSLTREQRGDLAARLAAGENLLPRLKAIEARRLREADPASRHPDWQNCAADPVYWMTHYAWTYNPRLLPADPFLRFVPYPKQIELIRWVQEKEAAREAAGLDVAVEGLIEKSRYVGVTWLCCAYAVHGWLFRPGFKAGFGSRKLDLVDKKGDYDSIFEKIRYLVRKVPDWQVPRGFSERLHSGECLLQNPETGATITGEGGDSVGRGGRSYIFFVDEAAFLEHAESAESGLSGNAGIVIWLSTPSGMGNLFYRKRHGGQVPVFRFHWKDDPRKNTLLTRADGTPYYPWYEAETKGKDEVTIAQELDIDYTASVEGVCLPAAWVRAAVDLADLVGYCPITAAEAGWDVAGERGAAQNVLAVRHGPVVFPVVRWNNMDPTQSAWKARDACHLHRARRLAYDAGGVGEGVTGALRASSAPLNFTPDPFLFGGEVTKTIWEDGVSSKERFINRRAEEYWRLRVRFKKAYELRQFLESGGAQGREHPFEECISIPNDAELIADLSIPRFEVADTGKTKVMSKMAMRKIGLKSPDNADALVTLFATSGSWAHDERAWDLLKQLALSRSGAGPHLPHAPLSLAR